MEIEAEMLRYLATKFTKDAERLEALMRKQSTTEVKAMMKPKAKAEKKPAAKATTAKTAPKAKAKKKA